MTTTQEHAVSVTKRQGQAHVEFGNPPVAETAVGFYFERIDGWNVLHHGALWERFRAKYPDCEFLPTLLESTSSQPSTLLDVQSFPLRVGFVDKTKTQLVQTQNGLLLHNWRKAAGATEYPRYEAIQSQLREDWRTLKAYLGEHSLKLPTVTRCEMDYFNHLVRGEEWQDFSDLPKTFTVWRGIDRSASGNLETASFSLSYRLDKGTVNAVAQPAIRTSDGKELIQFTLSSSAVPANSQDDELFACLDECHNNAARAFIDFTTDEARERWKQNK